MLEWSERALVSTVFISQIEQVDILSRICFSRSVILLLCEDTLQLWSNFESSDNLSAHVSDLVLFRSVNTVFSLIVDIVAPTYRFSPQLVFVDESRTTRRQVFERCVMMVWPKRYVGCFNRWCQTWNRFKQAKILEKLDHRIFDRFDEMFQAIELRTS